MRIKLEFERTAKIKETGWVEVEVGSKSSVADVYKAAIAKEFTQFLTAERNYENEEWEFSIVKEQDPQHAA